MALHHVVDAAKRVLRPSDVLFRDDDQFVAVLLHTSEADGMSMAAQLHSAVATSRGGPNTVAITVSVALAPRDASTLEGLLEVARQKSVSQSTSCDPSQLNDRVH